MRLRKIYLLRGSEKVSENNRISLKFSGYLSNTLNNISCLIKIFVTLKTFHRQWAEQLIVTKSAAAVKEEKRILNKVVLSDIKIIFFFNIFTLLLS
jgi:hypothetical protein